MTFVADESVDRQIVEAPIPEDRPGVNDQEVLNRSVRSGSVLLTADKDFGELVFRQKLLHTGVVLSRLHGLPPVAKGQVAAAAIKANETEFTANFSVVTDKIVRIRRDRPM